MSVLDNFEEWKDFLGNRLEHAQKEGMSQGTINDLAYQLGDYLAKQVEPKNVQEKVLADLWNAASSDEQKAIASAMVKLVDK